MAKKVFTSPKGTAVYPHLNSPDTKFKTAGEYHVKLRVTEAEAKALMDDIDAGLKANLAAVREEAVKKADTPKLKKAAAAIEMCKDKPYIIEKDDDDEETGYVIFVFKMLAGGVKKKTGEPWSQQPAIFDAAGVPVTDKKLRIGAGSLLRVSFEFNPFWTAKLGAGLQLRMKGVQVIKLVEWGQGNADYHGFTAEEEAGPGMEAEPGAGAAAGAGPGADDSDAEAAGSEDDDF